MQSSDTINKTVSQRRMHPMLENALYILGAAGLAVLIQSFVVRPFIVNGNSMDPTIQNQEYILIDQVTYKLEEPKRGDVIIFRAPPEPKKFYIKRIIGLPGETVSIDGTKVTITNKENPNGFTLEEDFITHTQANNLSVTVPEGEYFVMGDNRAGSFDSRMWGTLPKEEIRGRAWLRLFPFTNITYLPGKITYE